MAAIVKLRREQLTEQMTLAGIKTNEKLAERMGVGTSTVSRVRAGTMAPGEKFIPGLLAAFSDLTFDDLFEVVVTKDAAA